MAPNRRKNDHHHNNQGGQGQQQQQQRNGHHQQPNNGVGTRPMKCVRPTGCLDPNRMIYMEDIESGDIEVVRVTCNNLQCDQGNYMHSECFIEWEDSVLNFLSSTGRARSWSVKQRLQNLWTKKGYDLAFKACDCRCGKGHLRKDLDWVSPKEKMSRVRNQNGARNNAAAVVAAGAEGGAAAPAGAANNNHQQVAQQGQNNGGGGGDNANNQVGVEAAGKKKKKSKAKENLPTLSLSAPVPHPNDNHSRKVANNGGNGSGGGGSVPSTSLGSFDQAVGGAINGGARSISPPSNNEGFGGRSQPWNVPNGGFGIIGDGVLSAINRPRVNSLSSNASGSSMTYSGSGSPPSPGAQFGSPISMGQNAFKFQRKNSNGGERVRHNSTGSGFTRRTDFSSFNVLPRHKLNSYHIKMEDDGHGNDEMRSVILNVLNNLRINKVYCCLCRSSLVIYDRYPLIDGTFFLSPRQHSKEASIPMNPNSPDGRYLSAVCMHCLEGTTSTLVCRFCGKDWDGSSLVLGGCYNYDVFAATPCCLSRSSCTGCGAIMPKSPNYFSEFSQQLRCDRCGMIDFHLAKPIQMVFDRYTESQRLY